MALTDQCFISSPEYVKELFLNEMSCLYSSVEFHVSALGSVCGCYCQCDAQEATDTDTDAGEMEITTDVAADGSKLDPVSGVLWL